MPMTLCVCVCNNKRPAQQMYFELHVRPAPLDQRARSFLIGRIRQRDATALRTFPAKNGKKKKKRGGRFLI